jgi:hypothetical protein
LGAVGGVTKKYFTPCDGPWKVTRVKNPTTYEVANELGKIRKVVSQTAIRLCLKFMQKNYASIPKAKEVPHVTSCLCAILVLGGGFG